MSHLIDYLKGSGVAKSSKGESVVSYSFKSFAFGILKMLHFKTSDESQVYIHSSFRSGSTWLAEMLSSLPKARLVNEPLSPHKFKIEKLLLPVEPCQVYFDSGEKHRDVILGYLSKVADGKTHLAHRYDILSKNHSFISSLAVIKLLRATPLVKFLVQELVGVHVILIRHPISTAKSKIKSGIMVEGRVNKFLECRSYVTQYLTSELTELSYSILNKGEPLEIAVLEWCLDNMPLVNLKNSSENDIIALSYEQLVEEPVKTVSYILSQAGKLGHENRITNAANKVSAAAGSYSSELIKLKLSEGRAKDLLYSFASSLSDDEITRCLSIVNSFGLNIYSKENYNPTNFFTQISQLNEQHS